MATVIVRLSDMELVLLLSTDCIITYFNQRSKGVEFGVAFFMFQN